MSGYVHTIMGPMFSGKTSLLLHELERFARSGKRVILFSADAREDDLVVHSRRSLYEDINVARTKEPQAIYEAGASYDVVGLDEVQFFPKEVIPVLGRLAEQGKVVLASGLDQDFQGEPFLTTLALVTESEKITRLTSVCQRCGSQLAIRNFRKVASQERILEGAGEAYEARCRTCMKLDQTAGPALPFTPTDP
jgi:thymidine kinase